MRTLYSLILALIIANGLSGYSHIIKLDQEMKNAVGTYQVILDNRPETSFDLVIGKNHQMKIGNQRGVVVTLTEKGYIEITKAVTNAPCLRKITINDNSKKLGSCSIETKPFRHTVTGPSFCGNYTFGLTIDKQKKLKLKDKTTF